MYREGLGDVALARYETAQHPSTPTIENFSLIYIIGCVVEKLVAVFLVEEKMPPHVGKNPTHSPTPFEEASWSGLGIDMHVIGFYCVFLIEGKLHIIILYRIQGTSNVAFFFLHGYNY